MKQLGEEVASSQFGFSPPIYYNERLLDDLPVRVIEDDVEHIEGIPEDVSTPPTRWSPLRSMAFWDRLPEKAKAAWLAYAQKVSTFAGLK